MRCDLYEVTWTCLRSSGQAGTKLDCQNMSSDKHEHTTSYVLICVAEYDIILRDVPRGVLKTKGDVITTAF